MCLSVEKSFVKNPIPVMKCIKELTFRRYFNWWDATQEVGFCTPHRVRHVPINNGWFTATKPARRKGEYPGYYSIEGGYLHAYCKMPHGGRGSTKIPRDLYHSDDHYFQAYAFDVVAIGDRNDLVCKKLYIPAFDKTPEVSQQWLKANNIVLPDSIILPK